MVLKAVSVFAEATTLMRTQCSNIDVQRQHDLISISALEDNAMSSGCCGLCTSTIHSLHA